MSLLIGFLTFILVMNCLLLMLLVLIQLPKKEAGAGLAFGGAATDALFGAGSGNALTKLTKYTASFFIALSILLSVLHMQLAHQGSRRLEQELQRQSKNAPAPKAALPTPAANLPTPAVSPSPTTNVMVSTATNLLTPAPSSPTMATTNVPGVQAEAPAATTPAPAK